MEARYHYTCSCVDSTAEKITDMTDRARPVTLQTLRKHCIGLREWERDMGYAVRRGEKGLRLKNDWAVSFHKSRYCGRQCYYIDHSRIERVWTQKAQPERKTDYENTREPSRIPSEVAGPHASA